MNLHRNRASGRTMASPMSGKCDCHAPHIMPVMRYLEALKSLRELDPVRALRTWLTMAGIDSGPIFRHVDRWGNLRSGSLSGSAASEVVKEAAEACGLDRGGYSAHSLRTGFVSECDRRHVPSAAVRTVTGHQTDAMLNSYSRPGQLFADFAGAYFEGV